MCARGLHQIKKGFICRYFHTYYMKSKNTIMHIKVKSILSHVNTQNSGYTHEKEL